MARIVSWLRLPVQVQDVLLAVFVTLFQVLGTQRAALNQPEARPLADLNDVGFVLLAVAGLVLVARRRWPVAVFATAAAASLVYYAAGYPDGPGTVGLFVAVYTLTAQGDGHRSLRITAAGIAVLCVVWLAVAEVPPFNAAGWVLFRIGTAVMAAALGESVRSRRVLAAEALERADRAERTRDEEARRRVDAERLRIAREVHDTVAHAVAVINVQAGVTAHVLDKRPEQAARRWSPSSRPARGRWTSSARPSGCCAAPATGARRRQDWTRSRSWPAWRATPGSTSRSRCGPCHGSCQAPWTRPPTASSRSRSPTRSATPARRA